MSVATKEAEPIPPEMLPAGWRNGYVTSVELRRRYAGTIALGQSLRVGRRQGIVPWVRPDWQLTDDDLPVFATLAASLGSAIRAGEHMVALRDETAKLTAVVDHASDGIVVFDADGQIVVWSPAMEQDHRCLTSRSRESDNSNRRGLALRSRSAGLSPKANGPVQITRADGDGRELQVAVVAIESDEAGLASMSVLTVRDVTKERRVERMKSDFIATVSHELRTPITPIKGYAQLLRSRWQRMPDTKREDVLGTIEERANHLSRLVDDLLLASRVSDIETARLEVKVGRHVTGRSRRPRPLRRSQSWPVD